MNFKNIQRQLTQKTTNSIWNVQIGKSVETGVKVRLKGCLWEWLLLNDESVNHTQTVLVRFNCNTTYGHLRRESRLRGCLGQTGLWACLWEVFLILSWWRDAQFTVSRTVPWEGGPQLYTKPWACVSQHAASPRAPAWVLIPIPLNEGPWLRNVSQRNLFLT